MQLSTPEMRLVTLFYRMLRSAFSEKAPELPFVGRIRTRLTQSGNDLRQTLFWQLL